MRKKKKSPGGRGKTMLRLLHTLPAETQKIHKSGLIYKLFKSSFLNLKKLSFTH